jgi:hypothetical protein
MTDVTTAPKVKRRAPWRGRPRVKDARVRIRTLRFSPEEDAAVDKSAAQAGLSFGAFLRALALGSAGPRAKKRPQAERDLLARILGELGKLGSNVNQSAKWSNIEQAAPSFAELVKMREDIALMRAAVLQALARGDDRGD